MDPLTDGDCALMVCSMRLFHDYRELVDKNDSDRIVTIGNFDGVHSGHRAVLDMGRRHATRLGLDLTVLTFEPHPAQILKVDEPPLRLVEPARKIELLDECGVDEVLAQRFDMEFASLDATGFVTEILVRALRARLVIVGKNFRFGAGRKGDIKLLSALGDRLGFDVMGLDLVASGTAGISSSRIRDLVIRGEVARAGQVLGRYHEVPGTVIRGKGKGASMGFPTVNLDEVEVLSPGPGVYAAWCDLPGKTVAAAAYTGSRPTLEHGKTLEAHLLDFEGDLYGQRLGLRFVEQVRKEIKFADLDELVARIATDVAQIRSILEHGP